MLNLFGFEHGKHTFINMLSCTRMHKMIIKVFIFIQIGIHVMLCVRNRYKFKPFISDVYLLPL